MPHTLRLVLCTVALSIAADSSLAQPRSDRIRLVDPGLRLALQEGREQSSTLRRLVASIEDSDVIVHVIRGADRSSAAAGALRWVTSAGGVRYLRISISETLPASVTAAALAHELQHVLEVVQAPSVRDAASFAALFRRLGQPQPRVCGDCYDTEAARRIQRQVRRELTR
jgi:hypothetical protein